MTWVPLGIVLGSAGLGTALWLRGEVELGVRLAAVDDRVVVADVRAGGLADEAGVRPGHEVLGLNGPEPPTGGGLPLVTEQADGSIEMPGDPPESPIPADEIDFLLTGVVTETGPADGIAEAVALRRSSLEAALDASVWVLLVAAVITGGGWLWRLWRDSSKARLGSSAAATLAVPLFALPAELSGLLWAQALGVVLAAAALLAFVVLTARFGLRLRARRRVALASAGLIACGVALNLLALVNTQDDRWTAIGGGASLAAAALLPAAAGAVRSRRSHQADALLLRVDLAIAGLAVGIVLFLAAVDRLSAILVVLVVAMCLAVRRFAVLPFAWMARRADAQRDAVVAAVEAERAHLSAELHDDIIQDMSLLIRRLRKGGDDDSVRAAREIGTRLRGVSGDLHLPILDDLGLGPALEWLAGRVGQMDGQEVRVDLDCEERPPPEIELALFRVAQEALSNALRHGAPPFGLRCETSARQAVLSVRDGGPGLSNRRDGELANHHGLATMEQRAETIGGRLTIQSSPTGGIQVMVEWRRT